MKSDPSLSKRAANVLAADARRARGVSSEGRAKAVEAMARAMRARNQRRRWLRGAIGFTAVAATIAIAVALGRGTNHPARPTVALKAAPAASAMFVRGTPVVERHGARMALSNGQPLEAGDRVVVEPGSRTTVALPNGTALVVNDDSELLFASSGPHTSFELGKGAVHADVAKLLPSERFIIRTPDAEVEVHGTSFDVIRVEADPACEHGVTTRVKVREGVVAVRSGGTETLVRANEAWPARCQTASAPAVIEAPPPETSVSTKRVNAPTSTLAAQNDLFEKAVSRKRAGDVRGAIASFDELLARFPSSHLAQSAMGERMKLLSGVDRTRAKAAARDYLQRYPHGFARKDAELLLSSD